jgi:hypothetical protein
VQTGERESITRIERACKALAESGIARITASAVGKFCTVHFNGPKAQSISNKPQTLAAFVKKWDQLHQMRRGRRSTSKRANRITIDDPSVAAYVRILEVERDEANRVRDRLLQAFRRMEPLQLSKRASQQDADEITISDIEKDSIRAFLNARNLADFGLTYDTRGRISDGGRIFVESAMVKLLVKLADSSTKQIR